MKKIFAIILGFMFLSLPLTSIAFEETNVSIEHLKLPKKLAKKTPTNIVRNQQESIEVLPYNTLQVSFAQDFNAKTANVGDEVVFLIDDGVSTVEGSKILPEATKIVANISNIEKPKSFNRSGKIYLDFKYIELPDGTQKPIQAKLFNKKDFLSRGKLNAWGKGFGSTFGGSALGIAAGCGIGVAANAVIIGGFAIGLPVGFAAGAVAGLVTPGLNYKAKAGDKINIQLLSNISIDK